MRTSGACSALNFAFVLGPSFIKNGHTLFVLNWVCSAAPGELVTDTVTGCPGSDGVGDDGAQRVTLVGGLERVRLGGGPRDRVAARAARVAVLPLVAVGHRRGAGPV